MKRLGFFVAALALVQAAMAGDKKFIELGWDIPDTKFLRENFRAMESEGPFDGVMFRVEATDDTGKQISTQSGWSATPWKKEWFNAALADLKACSFQKFTDNFVRFNATPKLIDWADEAGWNALEEKLHICGWLAREGGAKGIAADFEPYGENQWKFDATKGRSFAETVALARKRGAQFARGIASEKPDAVVLTLFLNSVVLRAGRSDEPDTVLAKEHYGLLPAFLNGMLDTAPPSMTIVDGCENGYYMDSVEAYQKAALDMRSWNGAAMKLVAPQNRAKYRQQVQAGFGFYLDMFVNEEGNHYFRGPLDGSRLKHLSRNLAAARDAADEYVWIYGEQCRWWSGLAKDKPWREEQLNKTAGKGHAWEEATPGITRAIAWSRDVEAAARFELESLRSRGAATNLAVNGDCSAKPERPGAKPTGWSAWQDEKHPTGKFDFDDSVGGGSARAIKVSWGCFIQKTPAAPGDAFVVKADCLSKGASMPGLTIRWQSADGKWTHEIDDKSFAFKSGKGDWKIVSAIATVPPDVGQIVVLLDVRDQQTDADICWFDNLEIYRLGASAP